MKNKMIANDTAEFRCRFSIFSSKIEIEFYEIFSFSFVLFMVIVHTTMRHRMMNIDCSQRLFSESNRIYVMRSAESHQISLRHRHIIYPPVQFTKWIEVENSKWHYPVLVGLLSNIYVYDRSIGSAIKEKREQSNAFSLAVPPARSASAYARWITLHGMTTSNYSD